MFKHVAVARAAALIAVAIFAGAPADAAAADPHEYQSLQEQSAREGAVRVMVNLDDIITLGAVAKSKVRLQQIANALRAELGQGAWKSGQWSNDGGQVGMYVTPQGLSTLLRSANAKSFTRDPTDKLRSRVLAHDGRLEAIEAALATTGFADVVVTGTSDADLDLLPDASIRLRESPTAATQAQAARASIQSSLGYLAVLKQDPASLASSTARINREAFVVLREHPNVRSIHLAGWSDARPSDWQRALLDDAAQHGSVDALIELRLPSPIVMGRGHMSPKAWQKQSAALKRALDDIVANVPGITITHDFSEWGAFGVRLDANSAARLYANADPRVLRVSANRPDVFPALGVSEGTLNMASAWNQNYRGAGQNIVILDTGIRKSHVFFQLNGASKVIFEGCWGTNSTTFGYTSPCPAQDTNGDSPLNYPGSGLPPVGCPDCPNHGTHVAGIAAGKQSASMPKSAAGATLQGVAPDAFLISGQIVSLDAAGGPSSFPNDQIAALQALSNTAANSSYAVLLNVADYGKNTSNCPGVNYTLANLIANLYSRGIPVIVPTGNRGTVTPRLGISYPACLPYAIKVPATNNDAAGNTVAAASSIAADSFAGPVLLAPGFSILSSTGASDTSVNEFGGTSFSAPHVVGYYAAIKAAVPTWSLADATAWVYSSGSVSAPQVLSGATYQFRRIRMP